MKFTINVQALGALTKDAVEATITSALSRAGFEEDAAPQAPAQKQLTRLERLREARGGQFVWVSIHDSHGHTNPARYLSIDTTAYIDASDIAGRDKVALDAALTTSTLGVGELCAHAFNAGHTHVNLLVAEDLQVYDMGLGIAVGLGVAFGGPDGRAFIPVGQTIPMVKSVGLNPVLFRKGAPKLTILAEQMPTLTGHTGVLERRTDLDATIRPALDANIRHINAALKQQGHKLGREAGSGAGLGLGAVAKAFLNAEIRDWGRIRADLEKGEVALPKMAVDTLMVTLPNADAPDALSRLNQQVANFNAKRLWVITNSPLEAVSDAVRSRATVVVPSVERDCELTEKLDNLFSLLKAYTK